MTIPASAAVLSLEQTLFRHGVGFLLEPVAICNSKRQLYKALKGP